MPVDSPESQDFILFHTYANHVMDQTLDPQEAAQFFVDQGLFNGIMIGPDHHKKVVHPPSVQWLKKHGVSILFSFFTNNHYAVPCAEMEGFGSDKTAYNEWWCRLIMDYMHEMGQGSSYWTIGHEQYDSFGPYPRLSEDGSVTEVRPQSRKEGFEFYRRWVTTNEHQLHWGPHCYENAPGFVRGKMTDQADTLTFLKDRGLSMPHGFMMGGISPQNAHYQFEIFPDQEVFWFECMHHSLPNAQVGMCFLRGAAAQYQRSIFTDVSPYAAYQTYHEDLEKAAKAAVNVPNSPYWTVYDEQGRRLGGYSESLHQRVWMSLWVGGSDQMLHEDSVATHLIDSGAKMQLSAWGKAHQQFADLVFGRGKDRGQIVPTAGVLLPFLHGMCPPVRPGEQAWPESRLPWHGLDPQRGDWAIARFFELAFPDHGYRPPWPGPVSPAHAEALEARKQYGRLVRSGADLRSLEEKHVTSSRWGDGLDVVLSNVTVDTMKRYPAIIALGDFDPEPDLAETIVRYLETGGRLLVSADLPCLPQLGFSASRGKQNKQGVSPVRFNDDTTVCEAADVDHHGVFQLRKAIASHKFSIVNLEPRTVSDATEVKVLATDRDGVPVLWEQRHHDGYLWVVCVDRFLDDDSRSPDFPDCVESIIDRFLLEQMPVLNDGPPVQWCVSRNRGGIRLYIANHNSFDILTRITLNPARCGCDPVQITVAQDLVERTPQQLTRHENRLEIDVFLNAFDFRLIQFGKSKNESDDNT